MSALSLPPSTASTSPSVGSLLAIDAASALVAAATLAPFVTIVDKAVTQAMSSPGAFGKSVVTSLTMLVRQPTVFLRQPSFLAVYAVYASTYLTANFVSTGCEVTQRSAAFTATAKLWLTFATNAAAGITKDRAFTRWFGAKAPTGLPARSWALFFGRDLLTIGAGFTLPSIVAEQLHERGVIADDAVSRKVAQIVTPMTAQLFLTPLHLLALDIYNHPARTGGERARSIASQYPQLTSSRMLRVLFAYGAGGIVNTGSRDSLRARLT